MYITTKLVSHAIHKQISIHTYIKSATHVLHAVFA